MSHPPLPFVAVVVRLFVLRPADPNRASGEGRDGSDPPFCAAGAARRMGVVSATVSGTVSDPPPRLRGGRSRLYVSLQEGSRARTRAGRQAATSGAMLDRLIRAFLVVGGVSVACAWTWPGAFPEADPVAVLVRYHTPNVYRAVVAWYDVAPGVAVFLAGQFLISSARIWFARMGVRVGLRSRLPTWPLSPSADGSDWLRTSRRCGWTPANGAPPSTSTVSPACPGARHPIMAVWRAADTVTPDGHARDGATAIPLADRRCRSAWSSLPGRCRTHRFSPWRVPRAASW